MSAGRIEVALRAAKAAGRAGLIPFLTAGDPDPAETLGLVVALAHAGADVVELGVPFSDPIADGPAIQRSSERALAHGVTIGTVLGLVREVRTLTSVPIVLFGYLNPVLAFGPERFAREAAAASVDGLLLTDLPIEEGEEFRGIFRREGLDTIQLASPTSGADRLPRIAAASSGFVYCISRAGVTGAREELPPGLPDLVAAVRASTTLPVAVGFGISTPAHARAVAAIADAIVVGSALVETIAAAATPAARIEEVVAFVSALARSISRGSASADAGPFGPDTPGRKP